MRSVPETFLVFKAVKFVLPPYNPCFGSIFLNLELFKSFQFLPVSYLPFLKNDYKKSVYLLMTDGQIYL